MNADKIYNWKKNSTDFYLAIINLFQLVPPYEKPTSSLKKN